MSIKKEYQERSGGWISEPSSLGIKEWKEMIWMIERNYCIAENIKRTLYQDYRTVYNHLNTLSMLKLNIDPEIADQE